jgi:uncharacterized protein (UPF0548 family)
MPVLLAQGGGEGAAMVNKAALRSWQEQKRILGRVHTHAHVMLQLSACPAVEGVAL